MDGDMMVVPAERRQVLGVVAPAVGSEDNMVGLQSVTRPARRNHTSAVTPEGEAPRGRWDRPGGRRGRHRAVLVDGYHLDGPFTKDSFERRGTYPRAGGHLSATLTCGCCGD